jgi:hypothetical protein
MNEILEFMTNTIIRAFAVAGYSFFGLIVATKDIQLCFTASLIAGGSYYFTELVRYFKIHPEEFMNKTGKRHFNFLLFP